MLSNRETIYIGSDEKLHEFMDSTIAKARIITFDIVREPLSTFVSGVMNMISGNRLAKVLKQMNYDEAYHLSMHCKLEGYKDFVSIEKNEVITVSKRGRELSKYAEYHTIKPDGSKSISDMLREFKEQYGHYRLLSYSAKDRNCQDFIMKSTLILQPSIKEKVKDFIKQDLATVFKSPLLRKFTNTLTDAGRLIRKIVYKASSLTPGTIIQLSLTELRKIMESFAHERHDKVHDMIMNDPDFDGTKENYDLLFQRYDNFLNDLKVRASTNDPVYRIRYTSILDDMYLKTTAYNKRMNCEKLYNLMNYYHQEHSQAEDDYYDSYDLYDNDETAANLESVRRSKVRKDKTEKAFLELYDKFDLCEFVHKEDHTHLIPNSIFNKIFAELPKPRQSKVEDRIVTLISGS